ncbi:hypothetical protein HDV04_001231 [Boothiomyces sp. JEL0838]|nr:hypothetical protein HDV04_001231 [Boothiomyces sp. JEL0838]
MLYFAIPLFFIIFRETIEAAIIVSVLLSFATRLNINEHMDRLSRKLKYAVIIGVVSGLVLTFGLGGIVIYVWYKYGENVWEKNELLWEGSLGVVSSVFITITAFAILKTKYLKEKLNKKLQTRIDNAQTQNATQDAESEMKSTVFMFFWISFLSVVREGLEAVVFMGGVAVSEPPSSIPVAAICGLVVGLLTGYIIHRGSAQLALKWFYATAAYVLFLMAAGLFSKSVGVFEDRAWTSIVPIDVDNPDAVVFDPRVNVWILAPEYSENSGFWSIFSAIFGYRKVATVGTIVSYTSFWICICLALVLVKLCARSKMESEGTASEDDISSGAAIMVVGRSSSDTIEQASK